MLQDPTSNPHWPAPQCRVTKDGSHPLPGKRGESPAPAPLQRLLCHSEAPRILDCCPGQGSTSTSQARLPLPSTPCCLQTPHSPPPQDLRVSSQALPAALQASPSPLAVGCALPHPSYPASYSGPRQETTHPSRRPNPAARAHRPGCCTSRLALPSTAAPALSTRPVSRRVARGPLKGTFAPFHRFGN